ncbi:hypothetical protein FOL46_007592 [Perkinsus olseni]|uniref:Uncharacterized protein n=1 Tax=Perkinsus olseni TaxID=32597 RepID=A0A7J6LCM3_PEROL|nr:hypothetical protein FOL46_007592 [Perkinsus olseni]
MLDWQRNLYRLLRRGNEDIKRCWAMRPARNRSILPTQQMRDVRMAFTGSLSVARLTSTFVCQNDDGTIDLGFYRGERAPVYTRTHFLFVNMVKVSDGTIFGILPADEETINYSLLNLRDGDVHEQPTSFGEVLTEFKDNRKRKADEDDEDDDVVEVPSQRIVTPDRLRPSQKISRGSEQGQRLLRYPTKFGDLKDYTPAPTGV